MVVCHLFCVEKPNLVTPASQEELESVVAAVLAATRAEEKWLVRNALDFNDAAWSSDASPLLDQEPPNCMTWAYGMPSAGWLRPGWIGLTRRNSGVSGDDLDAWELSDSHYIRLLELDGLTWMSSNSVTQRRVPCDGWLVAAYRREGTKDPDFHMRRLDKGFTWSEKCGDHPPRRIPVVSPSDLLAYRSPEPGTAAYGLSGFLWVPARPSPQTC